MNAEEYMSLYEKFLSGRCTPGEKEKLMSYQDKFRFNDVDDRFADDDHIKDETYSDIIDTLNRPVKRIRYWRYAAAAAVIIGLGVLWFTVLQQRQNNPATTSIVATAPQQAPLPKPGGHVALLTLGNGAQIKLSDAKPGILATNGESVVRKVKNGQLEYAGTGAAIASNTIFIPRGNMYRLTLPDGTKVWLNAETSLTFPTRFSGSERKVVLTGEAYFEVAKNKQMPFRITANGTEVEVLGTHFNVSAYPDDENVKTTLVEGSVKLSNKFTSALITPGQQGKLSGSSERIHIKQARTDEAIAWKDGYFIFHDESIVNVMKRAERWYDIEVEYRGDVKGYEFGGSIAKYNDISALLHIMELSTHNIHYKIEGRKVIIME